MTKICLDGLDKQRYQTFLKLGFLANKGVLAGGTALMLQINHRQSFDFDIFFRKPIINSALKRLKQYFSVKRKLVDLPGYKTIVTKQEVRITLFHYQFDSLYPKIKTESLPLFDKRDIAADKAYTLGRRPAWRDYVDLFFLLKNGCPTLKEIIKDGKQKFKSEFDEKLFLEQLIYYQDLASFKVKFIKQKYSPQQIQNYLKKEVLKYLKQKL
jgi:hypothetical protein